MKARLEKDINDILTQLGYPIFESNIQIPKDLSHGDFTTNIAMIIAKKLNEDPKNIAKKVVETLIANNLKSYKSIKIAGPGFINIILDDKSRLDILKEIKSKKENYGKTEIGKGQKALVEFVSANPTGPLTVAHGRGAIIGDIACRILEWNGYNVHREYYFNNAGRQMRILGKSLKARYLELLKIECEFPEDGYQGNYIVELAKILKNEFQDKLVDTDSDPTFKDFAEKNIFEQIKKTLKTLHIEFDSYFNEDDLYNNIDDILSQLQNIELIYEKEGATWFAGTKVNRPADRVLIKSTGEPTYRLPDMAYHKTKFDRNYDLIIDVFGADHKDAYPDVLEAMKQLNYNVDKIKVLIHQFVTLTKDGRAIKMSTRKADFVTLDELCEQVNPEVVRYFFIMRGMNSHLNFELDIAKEQSDKNPVYYLQYAHARICNILKRTEDLDHALNASKNLTLLTHEIEKNLVIELLRFSDIIHRSTLKLEAQIISNYLEELSAMFHKYYAKHRIISENEKLTCARLYLIDCIRIILSNGLGILGISSPRKM